MSKLAPETLHWAPVKLREVATFRGGNGFPERFQGHAQGLYPFIKVADLSEDGNEYEIRNSRNWLTAETYDQIRPVLHPPGAIVFAKVGAALKLNRRRVLTCPTAIDNNMMSIAAGERLDPRFLFAMMQTVDLAAFCQDGGLPSVNQANLGQFSFLLPPLDEQRRITAVLDAWDEGIATTERLIAAQRRRKNSLRKQLLGRCLDRQPRPDWRKSNLGDLFQERDERGGSERLLSITATRGVIDRDELERRDTSAEDKSAYKRITPGDIGFNTMRMWQGVSALSDLEGIVSPAYTVVRPRPDYVDGRFAAHLFKLPRMVHRFWSYSQGLVDDTLMLKFPQFAEISVTLPSIVEQRRIAEILDAEDQVIGLLEDLVERLRVQKRGLMKKLLAGEWRVPASARVSMPGGQLVPEAAE